MRFLLAFLLFIPSLAQAVCTGASYEDRLTPAERAELDARFAEAPYNQGILWEATKGEDHLTLVGTVHIFDPRLEGIAAQVAPDLAAASLLLVEATQEDQAALQRHLFATPDLAFYNTGPTLPERVSEAEWQEIRTAAASRGVPAVLAAKMRPWMLSMSLALPNCALADQIAGKQGLDHMLMVDAEELGIEVRSIEEWMTVIDILIEGTEEEHLRALKASLGTQEESAEMANSIVATYFAGKPLWGWELGRFQSRKMPGFSAEEGEAEFDALGQRLLADRNANWMPVIAETMATHDRVVMAVGAAHLGGEDGVLSLLAADGWEIRPR